MTKKIYIGLIVLALLVAGYGIAGHDADHIVLDNALVSGRILRISATSDGIIEPYTLDRATLLAKGQPLFTIRNNDTVANLAQYKEMLRSAIIAESLGCSRLASDRASLARAAAKVAFNHEALQRWQQLGKAGMATKETLDSRQLELDVSTMDKTVAERALERSSYENHEAVLLRPAVQKAVAQLRSAFFARGEGLVVAPADGYVYDVLTYPGRYVKKGDDLLVFIPREAPVIEANVLESEVALIKPGTPVTVLPDTGGGKIAFAGVVKSIVPSVAASFSQLPRNNMDSNWIKTSQRVPVLITLDARPANAADLPIGASVKVKISRKPPAGAAAAPAALPLPPPALPPAAEPALDKQFDAHLRAIVAEFRAEKMVSIRGCN